MQNFVSYFVPLLIKILFSLKNCEKYLIIYCKKLDNFVNEKGMRKDSGLFEDSVNNVGETRDILYSGVHLRRTIAARGAASVMAKNVYHRIFRISIIYRRSRAGRDP